MRGAGEARVQLQREGHILLGADGRAAGGVRVLGPGVLPEAEAHGAGQDARARARAPRRAHAPAHRGPLARRRPAPRRDGAGLPHRIRRQVNYLYLPTSKLRDSQFDCIIMFYCFWGNLMYSYNCIKKMYSLCIYLPSPVLMKKSINGFISNK